MSTPSSGAKAPSVTPSDSHHSIAGDLAARLSAGEDGDGLYRQIFESAAVGIVRVDVTGHIIEANACFSEIVGRSQVELVGLHVSHLSHPEDHATDTAEMRAFLAGESPRYKREKRYLRPNGEIVHVMVNGALLRDAEGAPWQIVAIAEDITERVRMQQALGTAEAAMRASKAKTEFLSRMSHELRTPLNAMLGFAQLLRVDPRHPLNEPQRQKVEHIERAGSHLLAMLSDVLDLSRIEAGSMPMSINAVPVGKVVEEALAMVSNQASAADLALSHSVPEPRMLVRADLVRLRQVLVNLLSNAIKYNVPKGRVWVDVSSDGGIASITIGDSGKGMTPEQKEHLFEPFNRLGAERTAIEGTGIGLVIVHRLLELMDGAVDVKSEPGRGSSFTVRLPLASAADGDGSLYDRPRSVFGALDDADGQTRTVLYAEDNAINVELVKQVIRMRPQWHLDVAPNGRQAIEMARRAPPDLLLLDMHLGDMSGLEVSDALMRDPETAVIPRVALSADAMPDQISEARSRGFVDYLTKPLEVSRFLKLLDTREEAGRSDRL